MEEVREKMQSTGESMVLEVPVKELRKTRVVKQVVLCTPSPWSLKVKVDDDNQLGIFFCSKGDSVQQLRLNGDRIKRGREFFNFLTGIYNFQIENNALVYDVCGMFAFPRAWNFLYGPSKLLDITKIKKGLETLHIRCWLYEGILHSALLHYIASDMQRLIEEATEEDLIALPVKDLYSLLESEDLNVDNEDLLLRFLQRYALFHPDNGMNELLKGIRVSRVSTACLIETLGYSSISKDVQFNIKINNELEFRSKFITHC